MQVPNGNYINGEWRTDGDHQLEVINKYTSEVINTVPEANAALLEEAITNTEIAFQSYSNTTAEERQNLLLKLTEALKANKDFFAQLISQEAGKPITYAKAEVERSITTLFNCARQSTQFTGEMIPMDYGAGSTKTAYTIKKPIGPVLGIAPFNFPLNLALHKIGPALAVGCSILIKPSPYTPLSLLAFAQLFDEVGGPNGVLNVLHTSIENAETMVKSDVFKMLSFTGSPQIGWKLKDIVGKKKVALELGGNAGAYIDEDAYIEKVAAQCAIGAFLYSGQICISTQRIYIHESIYTAFVEALKFASEKLKVGDPNKEDTIVGPLIDDIHVNRINDWVLEAKEAGAEIITGGTVINKSHRLYAPTILANVSPDLKVSCEEVFGPVVIVEPVKDYKVAVEKLNDSKFGLQAGMFVRDIEKIKWISHHLEVGGIIFNNVPGFRVDTMPYGGVKDSGLCREGITYAMEEMTEPRLIVY